MSDVGGNQRMTGVSWPFCREVGRRSRTPMASPGPRPGSRRTQAQPRSGPTVRRSLSDTSKWVIYVDFDDALPADGEPCDEATLAAWIDQLAALVSPHPDVGIAFHGAWRVAHSHAHAELLVAGLDRFVIGVVEPGPRAASILAHIESHPEVLNCLVLDCHADEFRPPLAAHLVALEPGSGIRDLAVLNQVRAWIETCESADTAGEAIAIRRRLLAGFVPPPSKAASRGADPETVEAVVTLLIEEFQLAHLETTNGVTLSVGEGTVGVDWRQLRLGQRLRCLVEGQHYSRVLSAVVLPEATDGSHNGTSAP